MKIVLSLCLLWAIAASKPVEGQVIIFESPKCVAMISRDSTLKEWEVSESKSVNRRFLITPKTFAIIDHDQNTNSNYVVSDWTETDLRMEWKIRTKSRKRQLWIYDKKGNMLFVFYLYSPAPNKRIGQITYLSNKN